MKQIKTIKFSSRIWIKKKNLKLSKENLKLTKKNGNKRNCAIKTTRKPKYSKKCRKKKNVSKMDKKPRKLTSKLQKVKIKRNLSLTLFNICFLMPFIKFHKMKMNNKKFNSVLISIILTKIKRIKCQKNKNLNKFNQENIRLLKKVKIARDSKRLNSHYNSITINKVKILICRVSIFNLPISLKIKLKVS